MENINDYRMAIICGLDDEDGLIRYFGENEEYRFHLECLKDYLYTYYNDLAKQIGADDLRANEEIIIYLNTLGNTGPCSHALGCSLNNGFPCERNAP